MGNSQNKGQYLGIIVLKTQEKYGNKKHLNKKCDSRSSSCTSYPVKTILIVVSSFQQPKGKNSKAKTTDGA